MGGGVWSGGRWRELEEGRECKRDWYVQFQLNTNDNDDDDEEEEFCH